MTFLGHGHAQTEAVERRRRMRRAVAFVGTVNLAYFVIEFTMASKIGSTSLFADSADFFEDGAVSVLIVAALDWSTERRARLGFILSMVLLAPALAFFFTLWDKFTAPVPPEPLQLSAVAVIAMAINLLSAGLLARYRDEADSLIKTAYLSARNDVIANAAIIGAAIVTRSIPSIWPDIVVGFGIAIMNIDAAREIWKTAHGERRLATTVMS